MEKILNGDLEMLEYYEYTLQIQPSLHADGLDAGKENSRITPSCLKETMECMLILFNERQKTGEGTCVDGCGIKNSL